MYTVNLLQIKNYLLQSNINYIKYIKEPFTREALFFITFKLILIKTKIKTVIPSTKNHQLSTTIIHQFRTNIFPDFLIFAQ